MCGALQGDGGFSVQVWTRSIGESLEEEGYHVLKESPLTVGAGAVESTRVKATRSKVFRDILSYRQRSMEVDQSSVGNMWMYLYFNCE